jgi:glycine/D-amino acid oxidase-like deaminating enzyme
MEFTRRETLAGVTAGAAALTTASRTSARTPAPETVDVAVIGAGVFGAWTAWHLKKAGRSVALFDQYGAGHARASSGGESRVIRVGYGADTIYSEMARASLAQWDALSRRQTQPILHRTGVLWWSPAGDAYAEKSVEWLRANAIAHEGGPTAWLRRRFPQIRFRDGESGFLESGSGALIAGRGVQAVVADAGLTVRQMAMRAPGAPSALYDLGPVRARSLVYALGPWLPKLFPDALGGRIFVTRQEVYHFGMPEGGMPGLPVWADLNGGDIAYGFPDIEGQGFKIAFDAHGPEVDPDTQDRRVSAEGVARARAFMKERFPDLADAPLIHSRVCQYENSSNGDFLIDRLPGHDRVWLAGAGSGHGFKHGPEVGKRVARHILNPATPIEPRFSLATKDKVQNRSVY